MTGGSAEPPVEEPSVGAAKSWLGKALEASLGTFAEATDGIFVQLETKQSATDTEVSVLKRQMETMRAEHESPQSCFGGIAENEPARRRMRQ